MSLESLYKLYYNHPEGAWIMKPDNVRMLFDFVKKNNITKVLDLGTGIGASAAVIALALKQKGVQFHIDTIEQYEKCHKLAQELMPEELKANVTFHRTDAVAWSTDKIPYTHFSNFKELPQENYDLILTDGPGPWIEGEDYIDLPNGDVLKMMLEDKVNKGAFIFFDGRIRALGTLERYFESNFYILDTVGKRCHILERKDNEVKFEDVQKRNMAKLNYI